MAPSAKKPIQSVGVGAAIPPQVTVTDPPGGTDAGAELRIADDGITDDGIADDGTADDGIADDGTADDGIADDGTADDGIAPPKSSRATASAVVEQALSFPVVSTALTEAK